MASWIFREENFAPTAFRTRLQGRHIPRSNTRAAIAARTPKGKTPL